MYIYIWPAKIYRLVLINVLRRNPGAVSPSFAPVGNGGANSDAGSAVPKPKPKPKPVPGGVPKAKTPAQEAKSVSKLNQLLIESAYCVFHSPL